MRPIHIDDEVIVIDKAPGLPVALHPGQPASTPNLLAAVRAQLAADGLRARLWFVHHIEPAASGLVVLARTERAREALRAEFRAGDARLTYTAVLEGRWPGGPTGDTTSIRSWLVSGRRGLESSPTAVGPARGAGKARAREGSTHLRRLREGSGRMLAQIRVEPGQPDQVPVQLASAGLSVAGDPRGRTTKQPRLALHATELSFTHPGTNAPARFHHDPPPFFDMLLGEERAAPDAPAAPAMPEPAPTIQVPPPALPVARERGPHAAHLEPAVEAPEAPTSASTPRTPPPPAPGIAETDMGWDHVARWYDTLLEERTSDLYEQVILPRTLDLLGAINGQRVLDIACGQGQLCRLLADRGALPTGLDAAPRLIEFARARGPERITYTTGDARAIAANRELRGFDAALCVMALMNIEPFAPVISGAAAALRAGGRAVIVLLHPGFRIPRHSDWQWEDNERQWRRLSAYLSEKQVPVTMNPGAAAAGAAPVTTWTYHRPVHTYLNALAGAGLALDRVEEWTSHRTSQPGPRAQAEDRARAEFPMFLALRARKPA